jgi:hypothetical protein
VQGESLADLPADAEHGVEGARRVLEDHGDAAAPHRVEGGRRRADQLGTVERHAAGDPRLGGEQAESGEPGHRFAGAGFADETEGLAAADMQVDAAQGGDARKRDAQVFDAHKGRITGGGTLRRHGGHQPMFTARKSMCSIG